MIYSFDQKIYLQTISSIINVRDTFDLEVKGMAMRGRNSASGCFEVMTFDTKGLSIQERMIKLYDGSIERSVLKISE